MRIALNKRLNNQFSCTNEKNMIVGSRQMSRIGISMQVAQMMKSVAATLWNYVSMNLKNSDVDLKNGCRRWMDGSVG